MSTAIQALSHDTRGERLWTTQEVARFLHLSKKAIYRLVEDRALPHVRVLNRLRFEPKDVEEFVRRRRVAQAEAAS